MIATDWIKGSAAGAAPLICKWARALELRSHVIPAGDLPAILERVLDVLIAKTRQQRYAVGLRTHRRSAISVSLPAGKSLT
jgi:hypothetical protein